MVLFHYCYDLRFLAGVRLDWFVPPLMDVWRDSISWTFLVVAGCMYAYSRSNLRRGLRYALVALLIWLVTYLAGVDTPISFGIIYCMAACTLVAWALGRLGLVPRGGLWALILLVVFLLLHGLPYGHLGFGALLVPLPSRLYSLGHLAWLGLPGPGFASGDYYPLLPYLPLYLCGTAVGLHLRDVGHPDWMHQVRCAPLELMGRHALPIYVIHQPLLLLLSGVLVP